MDTNDQIDRANETPDQALERLQREFPDARNLTQLAEAMSEQARRVLCVPAALESYRLVNREPVRCSFLEHVLYMSTTPPHLADDYLHDGAVRVSTVFIGVGYVIFETAVFHGEKVETCRRYRTWNAALAGHADLLAELKNPPPEDSDS